MPGSATSPSVGVSITVPDSWYEFDIRPAVRDDAVRAAVNERIRAIPDLARYRADLTRTLRQLARDAWDSGVIFFAGMAEGFEGVPLTATVTVSAVSAKDPSGRALSTEPEDIAASLIEKRARSNHDTWRTVRMVQIPGVGAAARTFGVEDIERPGDSRTFRVALMQTFVPVSAAHDRVVIISASTPVLDLAGSFLELFDAISGTFRFVQVPPDA